MMDKCLTKAELYRQMKRFYADKDRLITKNQFAKMAGYSDVYLRKIFIDETDDLTMAVQIRVSRTLLAWARGEIRVMQEPVSKTKTAEWRPGGQTRQKLTRQVTFQIKDGSIKLQPGVVNHFDYSQPGLDELLGDK